MVPKLSKVEKEKLATQVVDLLSLVCLSRHSE
jgi:hypothetical protein